MINNRTRTGFAGRALALLLAVCLALSLCSCGAKEDKDDSPAAVSERAMDNLVKKLDAGNYVVEIPGRIRTVVVSPKQVYVLFPHALAEYGYAFLTLKGETFAGYLEGGTFDDITFYSKGTAVDALGDMLPNSWKTVSGGNMFELFYNDPQAPLEFTSNDLRVKKTLVGIGGYKENLIGMMEEVRMILDAEDPSSVRFTAKVTDTSQSMIRYDDIDLSIVFGSAKSDARAAKWLKDPVYPAVRTGWTKDDAAEMDMVFMRGYGAQSVPFPGFASYALIFDDDAYEKYSMMILSDSHATEKDVEDYKAALVSAGYQEAEADDGEGGKTAVYRKLLRPEHKAYAELRPYFDDGFVLEGKLHFEHDVYEGLAEVSGAVAGHGFAELDDTDVFSGWSMTDLAAERSESWSFFFDYDLYGTVTLEYTDEEAAREYLSAYADRLAANGFKESFAPGIDGRLVTSPNEFVSFRYAFGPEGTVTLDFKNERSLTADQVLAGIREHGLPETDIHGDIGARDRTRYEFELMGFRGLFITVYQPYATQKEAEDYLDGYVERLIGQDYLPIDPEKIGSQRRFAYFNEEEKKYVAFDYIPLESGAEIFYELVSIEPEESGLMESTLGL